MNQMVYKHRGRPTKRDRRWQVRATPLGQKNTTYTYHRTYPFAWLSLIMFKTIGYGVELWDRGKK